MDDATNPAALRESEERYRFLAETVPVQIWTALPDGRLDYVSSKAERDFGIPTARLLDEGWLQVLHPDDVPLAVERWTRSLTTGEHYEIQFRLKIHDGSYAWHLARAVPQLDAAGRVVRWFGTNTNIEEQRELQRKTLALLAEVAEEARTMEATIASMRSERDAALSRLAALEAELKSR